MSQPTAAPWLRIALTGGIASGKSTVAALFEARGAAVIDTDALAHALTAPAGAALPALCAAFGSGILAPNGAMDRAAMRARAFADPDSRRRLEGILHPMIRVALDEALDAVLAPYVLLAIPLLVENAASWRDRVQRVLVVDCPEALQRARALQRPGLQAAELEAILAVQAARAQRLSYADDVIDNAGTPAHLAAQVARLDHFYRTLLPATADTRKSAQNAEGIG